MNNILCKKYDDFIQKKNHIVCKLTNTQNIYLLFITTKHVHIFRFLLNNLN